MTDPVNPVIPPEQSLIEYPSAFPIKVMGAHSEPFVEAIVEIRSEEHTSEFQSH